MSNHKQLYFLTEDVLWRLVGQGTHPGAQQADDRFRAIKAAGGAPQCFYSEFNGFSVLDENDPEQMRRSISMEQRAKPFPI
jgi:hypothetical protein